MDSILFQQIVACVKKYPKIRFLLLFGSRARTDATEQSDWDFGYIAQDGFDSTAFHTDLVILLGTDDVDLVDLSRANGLLRFRATQDGSKIYEKTEGEYEKFWLEAVHFWCDAGPIIRKEYEALLKI